MEQIVTNQVIKEAHFDEYAIPYYQLYLAFYESGLVSTVYDPSEKAFLLLKSYELPNRYWEQAGTGEILSDPIFQKKFQGIKVLISSSETTLVPAPFFREDLLKHYYQLNFKAQVGQNVFYNYVNAIDAYLVFAIDASFWNGIQKILPVEKPLHVGTSWLENLLMKGRWKTGQMLAADIENQVVRVAVIQEGHLQFFNSFRFQADQDLLYYLVYTANQFGLDPEQDDFWLSGLIETDSERYHLLSRYIRNIKFPDGFKTHSPGPELKKIPGHFYYHLFGTPLCVS